MVSNSVTVLPSPSTRTSTWFARPLGQIHSSGISCRHVLLGMSDPWILTVLAFRSLRGVRLPPLRLFLCELFLSRGLTHVKTLADRSIAGSGSRIGVRVSFYISCLLVLKLVNCYTVITFVSFHLQLSWETADIVIRLVILWVSLKVVVFGGNLSPDLILVPITALFSLPAVRGVMPSAPDFGSYSKCLDEFSRSSGLYLTL